MAELPEYRGASAFLSWTPKVLLVVAAAVLLSRWNHSLQFAALFVLCAYVHGRWLACEFLVGDDGIDLVFPFGRHRFLPKESLHIRMEFVGAIALKGRHRHWGYPLMDGVLYVPDHDVELRNAFLAHGYQIA